MSVVISLPEHECRYISAREGWYCSVCDRYWHVYSECLAHLEAPPPTYTLTIIVTGRGTTEPPPGSYTYSEGVNKRVTALRFSGWAFDHWMVNGETRPENPTTVTITKNTTLEAVFIETEVPPPPPVWPEWWWIAALGGGVALIAVVGVVAYQEEKRRQEMMMLMMRK